MPRHSRIKSDSNTYHIMSRALNKQILANLKTIDTGMLIMQLSRVTGIYYSKIQKMKKGQEGKVIGLTYYK